MAYANEIGVEMRDKDGQEQWTWHFAGSNNEVVASCAMVYPSREALDAALAVARKELAGAPIVQRDLHSGGVIEPKP